MKITFKHTDTNQKLEVRQEETGRLILPTNVYVSEAVLKENGWTRK